MTHGATLDSAADAAIARVLEAERAARAELDRTAIAAAGIVETARDDARSIRERTDRRIARLRERFAAQAAREIAAIEGEIAAQDSVRALDAEDLARVARAVAALAAELTTPAADKR